MWRRWLSTQQLTRYVGTVEAYASKPQTPVTLNEMLRWAEKPTTRERLIKSAQYVHQELPVRLAKRVDALQQLPLIVGMNPHIRSVCRLYFDSFERIRSFPAIRTIEEDDAFVTLLADLVRSHADVIPVLSRGISESAKYMPPDGIRSFLNGMIQARIGIRVIAEHHIALHSPPDSAFSGIIHHALSPQDVTKRCAAFAQELCEVNFGSYPSYIINGQTDTTFPYISVHLEYMLLELLKNSFRATVEFSEKTNRDDHPPVEITIGSSDEEVMIRIRDQGGGIPPERMASVWEYAYTTVNDDHETGQCSPLKIGTDGNFFTAATQLAVVTGTGGPIAGLGYGLPMARIYAEWAGGSLDLVSMSDYGCDAFIRLPRIGKHLTDLTI